MQRVARWDALVLAAHLVRVRSPHAGQFLPCTNHSNAIQAKIDGFLQHSSFAARAIKDGSLRMVIVHDVANLSLTSWANVSLVHYQQRHQSIAPNDARWEAFGAAIRTLRVRRRTCVFAIDFGDVAPIRDLRELCAFQGDAIFAGSDNCASPGSLQNGVKRWLRAVADRADFKPNRALRGFLYTPDSPAFNSGILGGALAMFERFLAALQQRTRDHYHLLEKKTGRAPQFVIDMLVVNEILLNWSSPIITGFPEGPINMPMFGNVCKPWNPCDSDYSRLSVSDGDFRVSTLIDTSSSRTPLAPTLAWGIFANTTARRLGKRKQIRYVAEPGLRSSPPRHSGRMYKSGQTTPSQPVDYEFAPGYGLRSFPIPYLSARRTYLNATSSQNEKTLVSPKACSKSVLRELLPYYYFRHKLYCGNAIPC